MRLVLEYVAPDVYTLDEFFEGFRGNFTLTDMFATTRSIKLIPFQMC